MKPQKILSTSLRITLILLIVLAGAVILFNRTLRSPNTIALPAQVAGLALARLLSGAEAAAAVNLIYGEEFALTSAQVGYYGGDEDIVVRVGGTPFAGATRKIAAVITDKLDGTGGLMPISERRDRGRSIFMLEDEDGHTHFYFQSERYLIWFSGPSEQVEAALKELLEFYP